MEEEDLGGEGEEGDDKLFLRLKSSLSSLGGMKEVSFGVGEVHFIFFSLFIFPSHFHIFFCVCVQLSHESGGTKTMYFFFCVCVCFNPNYFPYFLPFSQRTAHPMGRTI